MADPAGAALGAVSLATALSGTLVSVVECFEYMQLGRHFGKDFDKSQARLAVLKLQITRLGVSIGALEDPATAPAGPIQDDASEVERRAEKYRNGSSSASDLAPGAPSSDDDEGATARALVSQTDAIVANRLRKVSWTRKTKWALYEKKYFDRLLADVSENLGLVEKLFEEKSITQVAESQRELCRVEAGQVQDGQVTGVVELLRNTSQANGDTLLEQAVRDAIASRGTGHRWERVEINDEVTLEQGDRIAEGYTGHALVGRVGHTYGVTIARGKAKIRQGDTYGST